MAWIFSIAALISLIGSIWTFVLSLGGSKTWLWVTGGFIYIFSFISGFSIGLYVVPVAFMFWALALAYGFKWVKGPLQLIMTSLLGLTLGFLAVIYLRYWVFAPLFPLLNT